MTAGITALEPARIQMEPRAAIHLDIFSGRPNPSWTLADGPARVLLSKLNSTRRSTPRPMPEGLGFRGFRITVIDGQREREFRVFGSRIQEGDQSYSDEDKAVEAFIVSTMPAELKREFADILPHR